LVLVGCVTVLFGAALWSLPREHARLLAVARQALDVALPHWHTLEPVNEVVYGTRGFDTFGETFILLSAVIGIGLVSRAREPRRGFIGEEVAGARERRQDDPPRARGRSETQADQAEREEQGSKRGPRTPDREPLGSPFPERAEGMSVVVRGAVRVVAPLLLVIGLYVVAWGYSPGGGFPGGAVVLGVVLLAYVAFGYRRIERVVRPGVVEPLEMAGALAIVVLGLLGLAFAGSFLASFLPLGQAETIPSGGILQAFSVSELVEVGTGLTLAVFGLLGMTHDWTNDDEAPSNGGSRRAPRRRSKAAR
jgi:multicomponent Na+:H+ antiporter subunit B